MFKVMMSDLETYKQKEDMTKELATYFSPFSPIQQFSQEVLFKQPQSKDKIIDVNLGMKNKDAELIKKLEKENKNLKDVSSQNEKLKSDAAKFKEKYQNEKSAKEILQNKVEELDFALREQKVMADEAGQKV